MVSLGFILNGKKLRATGDMDWNNQVGNQELDTGTGYFEVYALSVVDAKIYGYRSEGEFILDEDHEYWVDILRRRSDFL